MSEAEWIERAAELLERVQKAVFACAPPIFAQQIADLLAASPEIKPDLVERSTAL